MMTRTETKKWPNGIEARTYEHEGVTFRANEQNRIYWMSDWCKCWEFKRRGIFRSVFGGPETFGHVDFYLTES